MNKKVYSWDWDVDVKYSAHVCKKIKVIKKSNKNYKQVKLHVLFLLQQEQFLQSVYKNHLNWLQYTESSSEILNNHDVLICTPLLH